MTERFIDPNIERKNVLQDAHLKNAPRLPGGEPLFSHVEFSICGLCNRVCSFCPRADPEVYPNKTEYLSIDLYKKILSELAEISYTGRLSYSGFSEPYYHKRLIEMVSLTKQYLPNGTIEIVTNGDMLNAEKLRAIYDAGLDRMSISMYDGPEQIEFFEKMRDEAGVPENWLLLRKRYLGPDEDFGITLSNRAGTVTGMEEHGVVTLDKALKSPCYYTHYRMMVDHTGDVLLCPHDWTKRKIVGDLNKENIIDVWTGRAMSAVRRKLGNGIRGFAPCNVCDVTGTLQGGEHFKAWMELEGSE